MKDLDILIFGSFFLSLTSLKEVKQDLSSSISLFLIIINLKVILREFLGPADLAKTHVFYIDKSTKVIMVNKDQQLIFAALQIVAPGFKALNISQKLLIMDLVASFDGNHFLEDKGY